MLCHVSRSNLSLGACLSHSQIAATTTSKEKMFENSIKKEEKNNLIFFINFSIFSVNKISSLADFEECPNLQELYLRKNCIQDINDLVYLQVSMIILHESFKMRPCDISHPSSFSFSMSDKVI